MATFTRKHFEAIASILHTAAQEAETIQVRATVEDIVDRLAELFEEDNPSFDSDRFRERIGL